MKLHAFALLSLIWFNGVCQAPAESGSKNDNSPIYGPKATNTPAYYKTKIVVKYDNGLPYTTAYARYYEREVHAYADSLGALYISYSVAYKDGIPQITTGYCEIYTSSRNQNPAWSGDIRLVLYFGESWPEPVEIIIPGTQ